MDGRFGFAMETIEFLNLLQVGSRVLPRGGGGNLGSLLVDGSLGFEMETFEFLNLLQVGSGVLVSGGGG